MPRLHFFVSNGTLGCRKAFIFYFHSKVPRISDFWHSKPVLSVHSLACGLGLKHISFEESNGFALQLQALPCSAKCTVNVIDFSSSSLINMHNHSAP